MWAQGGPTYFTLYGLSEIDLGDGRTGIIMGDMAVNFKAEGYMFDELRIDTHVGEFSRNEFRIFHRVTEGEILVALAEAGFVTFDYGREKIISVPGTFLRAGPGRTWRRGCARVKPDHPTGWSRHALF